MYRRVQMSNVKMSRSLNELFKLLGQMSLNFQPTFSSTQFDRNRRSPGRKPSENPRKRGSGAHLQSRQR